MINESPAPRKGGLTRRSLLQAAAVGFAGAFAARLRAASPSSVPIPIATSRPAPQIGPPDRPWWLADKDAKSRVVEVRAKDVFSVWVVDETVLANMLRKGMELLTGERSIEQAWRTVLGDARNITIKFNRVGADQIRTTAPMARVVVNSLAAADYNPNRIALIEAPAYVAKDLGTRKPTAGWGAPIPVGGNMEPLANYVYESDAIINVPFLKTHAVAGMSGAMKNLSHAIVAHPARYHDNACAPYVGQVIGHREVSNRIRLNLVNAIRTVYQRGPGADDKNISSYGGILLGFDPVAVDSVGLDVLALQRRARKVGGYVDVPYLENAHERGVGRRQRHELEQFVIMD